MYYYQCVDLLWLLLADFPPYNITTPSRLANLNVELVTEGERYKMNISWAINIDGRGQRFVLFSPENFETHVCC